MPPSDDNGTLAGKVAFLTGGASGIGRATTWAFARQGSTRYRCCFSTAAAIVNTSSGAGIKVFGRGTAYAAAKHGVDGLTKDAALEPVHQSCIAGVSCPPRNRRDGCCRP